MSQTHKLIPYAKILKFNIDFFQHQKYPNCRYGQAFCNTFDINDNLLFYCDDKTASRHIQSNYITYEECNG